MPFCEEAFVLKEFDSVKSQLKILLKTFYFRYSNSNNLGNACYKNELFIHFITGFHNVPFR